MPRGAEKHSAHCERVRVRAERLRDRFQLPPAIALTYSRPNSSTEIDASMHFSRRSSRHLAGHRLIHTCWNGVEARPSRALTCVPDARPRFSASHRDVPDARPRSAHLTETGTLTILGLTFPRTRGVVSRCHSAGRSCARVATRHAARPSLRRRPFALGRSRAAFFSSAFAGVLAWLLSGRRVSPGPPVIAM